MAKVGTAKWYEQELLQHRERDKDARPAETAFILLKVVAELHADNAFLGEQTRLAMAAVKKLEGKL